MPTTPGPSACRSSIALPSPMTVGNPPRRPRPQDVERLDAFAREFAWARGAEPVMRPPWSASGSAWTTTSTRPTPWPAPSILRKDAGPRARTAAPLAAAVFAIFEDALGLPLHGDVKALPPEALAKAQARDEARAAKDWARADRLRAELQAEGWIVEDGPDGTTLRCTAPSYLTGSPRRDGLQPRRI